VRLHLVKNRFLILPVLCWLGLQSSPAQMDPASAGMPDFAPLLRLFGAHTNFSAKAELRVLGKNQREKIFTPLDVALLDRKLRLQIDAAQVRNASMPANAATGMKELGLDRVISLVRPDRQMTYAIFPNLKSLIKTPFTASDLAAHKGGAKLNKVPIGKETLDGRECIKQQVTLTDAQGSRREFTTWEAAGLRDFPVQIASREREDSIVLRFRQVQLTRPEPKQFEPPANFTEHRDVHSFMTSVLERRVLTAKKTTKR
jgi:hypothetical protein